RKARHAGAEKSSGAHGIRQAPHIPPKVSHEPAPPANMVYRSLGCGHGTPGGVREMGAASIRSRAGGLAILVAGGLVCAALPCAAAAEAPVPQYGTNDAGGFRNILPSGENGFDNATQL